MNRNIILSAVALSALSARAFANEAGSQTATKPAAARIEPVISEVSTDVPMPSRASKRGSVSLYPFDQLTAVGASFHVANKTAKQLSSIVSNANRKALVDKTDANGAIVMKPGAELKDAAGAVVGRAPGTEAEKVAGKKFFAIDVDKKDPKGAGARVFREL